MPVQYKFKGNDFGQFFQLFILKFCQLLCHHDSFIFTSVLSCLQKNKMLVHVQQSCEIFWETLYK